MTEALPTAVAGAGAAVLRIGPYALPNRLMVAPMAGVTDRPFRQLCKRLGAGHAVSEMVTSKRELWHSLKTSRRANHAGESAPIAVQIAGVDPQEMADAARHNIDQGAQIIDINMGCPAKKVCNRWAGSALMQNEALALRIVQAVVQACAPQGVPVTLKMRTGWAAHCKNAPRLAVAAEDAGVALLSIHGRTREQGYSGVAEHDTTADVKTRVRIPVVANGDINTAQAAQRVLAATGADAVMVGRAAQGRPWVFQEMAHFLATGVVLPQPPLETLKEWLLEHLQDHWALYGEEAGVRSARKHLGWYAQSIAAAPPTRAAFRQRMLAATTAAAQWQTVADFFDALLAQGPNPPADAAAVANAPPNDPPTAAAAPNGGCFDGTVGSKMLFF